MSLKLESSFGFKLHLSSIVVGPWSSFLEASVGAATLVKAYPLVSLLADLGPGGWAQDFRGRSPRLMDSCSRSLSPRSAWGAA